MDVEDKKDLWLGHDFARRILLYQVREVVNMKKGIFFVFVLSLVLIIGVFVFRNKNAQSQQSDIGLEAPEFTLSTVEGKEISLSSLKGAVVMLDFWASWCPYCVEGVPHAKQLYSAYQDKDFELIGINFRESERKVQSFIDARGVTYPILLDTDGKVAQMYGVRGLPTYLIIDANGIVKYKGHSIPSNVEDIIESLLPEAE